MTDTRTQIMDLAETLIRTKGYNAFSYKDVAVPLSIKNAAVHYHFPSKADLGKAIIERTMQRMEGQAAEWSLLPPKERLAKFIGIYKESFAEEKICFMGALGPSYESLPEVMKEELAVASQKIRLLLRAILKEGRSAGQFNFVETVTEKADIIIAALLSALVLSKVTGDNVVKSVSNAILKTV